MVKIGIIGCGNMGSGHARRLTQDLGHKIAAACDVSPETRETFKSKFPEAAMYKDHEEMLAHEKPDAVWICTEPISSQRSKMLRLTWMSWIRR